MLGKRSGALMVRLPSIKARSLTVGDPPRNVSLRMLQRRSAMPLQRLFGLYFTRMCLLSPEVQRALRSFIESLAKETAKKARPLTKKHISDAALKRYIAEDLTSGRGTMDALFADVFSALFYGREPLPASSVWAVALQRLLDKLHSTPSFAQLARDCAGDAAASAFVATLLIRMLSDAKGAGGNMRSDMARDNADRVASRTSRGKSGKGEGEAPASGDEDAQPGGGAAAVRNAERFAQSLRSKADPMLRSKREYDEQTGSTLDDTLDGLDAGNDHAKDEARATGGYIAGEGHDDSNADDDQRALQALRAFHCMFARRATYAQSMLDASYDDTVELGTLRDVLSCVGRVKGLLYEADSSSKHGDGEVVDIVPGNALQNVIPSEYVNFVVPELRPLFMQRMVDEQLLSFERRGFGEMGNGPLIALIDCSSSMSGVGAPMALHAGDKPVQVAPYAIACAFAIALAQYATRWGRDYILVPFDTSVQWDRRVVNMAHRRPTREQLRSELLRACMCPCRGGTNFVQSLISLRQGLEGDVALRNQFSEGGCMESADVIFFTDGQGSVPSGNREVADGDYVPCLRSDVLNALDVARANRDTITRHFSMPLSMYGISVPNKISTAPNTLPRIGGFEQEFLAQCLWIDGVRARFGPRTRFFSVTLATLNATGKDAPNATRGSGWADGYRNSASSTMGLNRGGERGRRAQQFLAEARQRARHTLYSDDDLCFTYWLVWSNAALFDHSGVIYNNAIEEGLRDFFETIVAEAFYGEHVNAEDY